MQSDRAYVPWVFVIFFHIIVGPIFLLFISNMYAAYPTILDGIYGFLGMVLFVVPFVAAMVFGMLPFTILGIVNGLLMSFSVNRPISILVIAFLAAGLGTICSMVAGDNRPFLALPSAISAILCYLICKRNQEKSSHYQSKTKE